MLDSTWLGTSSAVWSDNANWDTPPASGQALIFPITASNPTNTNDLTAGTTYSSLSLAGSGYTIGGSEIGLTAGIVSSATGGLNRLNLPIALSNTTTVEVTNSDAALELGGSILGSSGLTKLGAGTLELSGVGLYSGTTAISAGSMRVTGTAASSSFRVDAGGVLTGRGTVGALLVDGGSVAPGTTTPQILTVDGSLSLSNSATLFVGLSGTTPGSGGYSQLVADSVSILDADLSPALNFSPVGNQVFRIVDNVGTDPISGTFTGLPEGAVFEIGERPFSISYVGGTGNDVVLTHLVDSTTDLSATPATTVFGQSVSLVATVSGTGTLPTGSVVFRAGSTTLGTGVLNAGIATLEVTSLPVGTNSITAEYQGDGSKAPSTSSAQSVIVNQAVVSNVLQATPNPTVFGQNVTLTSTVTAVAPGSGTPTGTVEFFAGAVSLGTSTLASGVATLDTRNIPLGNSTLTAVYSGNTNYLAGTSNGVSFGVGQSNSVATISSTPNPSTLGQSVTLTSNVSAATPGFGTPTGTVRFFAGSTLLGSATLSSGTAQLETTALLGGTQSLTAQYQGDANFAAATSPAVNHTVSQSSTSTILAVSTTSAVFGQQVTFTATVGSNTPDTPTPTGNVEFRRGSTVLQSVALVNGVATLNSTTLNIGENAITAVYLGNASYLTSTSASLTVSVAQSQSTTALTLSPSPSVVGQSVTLTATIAAVAPGSGTPTGIVQFFQGTTSLGTANLASGSATFTVPNLPQGTASFSAQYRGDTNFAASVSSTVSTNVTQAATTTVVTASDTAPQAFRRVTLTATVRPTSGTGVPTGTVVFFVDGIPLGSAVLASGTGTLSTTVLPTGTSTVTAQYFGDSNNTASTSAGLQMFVGTPEQQFIGSLFRQVLSRPVDLKSMLFWENRLADGMNPSRIALTLANSPEGRRNAVDRQYQLYLDRSATRREIAAGLPAANTARFGAKPIVLGSREFYTNVGGGTDAGYVNALGTAILGTPFDAQIASTLQRSLQAGASTRSVANQALNQTVSKQALVQSVYRTLLQRDASTSELDSAVRRLSAPGGSLRRLEISILTSNEYLLVASGLESDAS
ncbi:MAG: Ig-like domain repeat protein [Isosphaeraceae bacterium]|nr:Ig-like domain repeat protein [Isosphaeraceae bacterium]